mmetsp:Transcript_58208/g.170853  ORF Transcript_58208/g.170853 Transcript_58208/m.170853 type:complete len:320 (+) Transcript_58208:337-1296(+)
MILVSERILALRAEAAILQRLPEAHQLESAVGPRLHHDQGQALLRQPAPQDRGQRELLGREVEAVGRDDQVELVLAVWQRLAVRVLGQPLHIAPVPRLAAGLVLVLLPEVVEDADARSVQPQRGTPLLLQLLHPPPQSHQRLVGAVRERDGPRAVERGHEAHEADAAADLEHALASDEVPQLPVDAVRGHQGGDPDLGADRRSGAEGQRLGAEDEVDLRVQGTATGDYGGHRQTSKAARRRPGPAQALRRRPGRGRAGAPLASASLGVAESAPLLPDRCPPGAPPAGPPAHGGLQAHGGLGTAAAAAGSPPSPSRPDAA